MSRFVLALTVSVSLLAGCAYDRCQRVSFRDGCPKCPKVAYRSGDRCHLASFGGCKNCERTAYRACDGCHRAAFLGFEGEHKAYGRDVTYGESTYEVRYDEHFVPGSPMYLGYTRYTDVDQDTGTTEYRLTASQPSSMDNDFARDAAFINQTEIELGRLALQNASNADVKNFGQRLIDDHNQARTNLENAVRNRNIDLPDDLDADHMGKMNQLRGVTGADFDRQFINMMITDHREAINKFEQRASSPPANQVQSFAIQTLPKLRQHLQMAQDIQKRIGG